jgi:hypothetical protein
MVAAAVAVVDVDVMAEPEPAGTVAYFHGSGQGRQRSDGYPSFRIGKIRTPDHISTLRSDKSLHAGLLHSGIGITNMVDVLAQLDRLIVVKEIFYHMVMVP